VTGVVQRRGFESLDALRFDANEHLDDQHGLSPRSEIPRPANARGERGNQGKPAGK